MNPTDVLGPAVGGLVVFMVFAVPIVAIIAVMAVIMTLSTKRHRERMKMIEQGLVPTTTPKKSRRSYALIGWGAVLLAFGLALTVGMLISGDPDELTPGLMFGFIGLAMIIVHFVIASQRKREELPDNNGRADNPPPQT
jgi:preprotein translocase subunit YajC